MNNNTETEKLLAHQKHQLVVAEKTKVLLLEQASSYESKFADIKKNLGWDELEVEQAQELRSTLELITAAESYVNEGILTEEALVLYCIKHNYVVCNIKDYKGMVPTELLEAIHEYSTSRDIRLDSDANLKNLFLLCRFPDTKSNNAKDIKKSKRYKKGIYPKILMIEKIDRGNTYKADYYKIIFEQGYKTPISNFLRSLFMTHTKQINFMNNIIFWMIWPILLLLITLTVTLCSSSPVEWIMFNDHIKWLLGIPIGVLFIKSIVPILAQSSGGGDGVSLNVFDDDGYKKTSIASSDARKVNTSYMGYMVQRVLNIPKSFKVKRQLIIKNQTSYYVMMGLAILLYMGVLWTVRLVNINKHDMITSVHSVVANQRLAEYDSKSKKVIYSLGSKCDATTFKKITPFSYSTVRSVKIHKP